MARKIVKLTPRKLAKLVLEEKSRFVSRKKNKKRKRFNEVLETGKENPEDVAADEHDADDFANTLEKDIDHLKALKIKEARIKRKLQRIQARRKTVYREALKRHK